MQEVTKYSVNVFVKNRQIDMNLNTTEGPVKIQPEEHTYNTQDTYAPLLPSTTYNLFTFEILWAHGHNTKSPTVYGCLMTRSVCVALTQTKSQVS